MSWRVEPYLIIYDQAPTAKQTKNWYLKQTPSQFQSFIFCQCCCCCCRNKHQRTLRSPHSYLLFKRKMILIFILFSFRCPRLAYSSIMIVVIILWKRFKKMKRDQLIKCENIWTTQIIEGAIYYCNPRVIK